MSFDRPRSLVFHILREAQLPCFDWSRLWRNIPSNFHGQLTPLKVQSGGLYFSSEILTHVLVGRHFCSPFPHFWAPRWKNLALKMHVQQTRNLEALAVLTSATCLTEEPGSSTRGNFFPFSLEQIACHQPNTWRTPAQRKVLHPALLRASLGIPLSSGTFLREEQSRRPRCNFIRLYNSKTFKPINSKGSKSDLYNRESRLTEAKANRNCRPHSAKRNQSCCVTCLSWQPAA